MTDNAAKDNMPDPVGGREAETEAALALLRELTMKYGQEDALNTVEDALDAVRSSGSAAEDGREAEVEAVAREMRNLRGPATERLVHEWADRLRSSGSAAQTNDAARKLGSAERWRRIYAAHGADLQTAPSDALDLEPESRSSGSAAQNQEQRGGARTKVCCPGCGRTLGDVMESLVRQRGRFKAQRNEARAELERLKAARSSQGEDLTAEDMVCACLDETGGRKVELVERCLRCGALMRHDPPAEVPLDAGWDGMPNR